MSTATHVVSAPPQLGTATAAPATTHTPSYQAYRILQAGFTLAPIVAGLDKFFHVLVNWDQYLPGFVNGLTGGRGHELMLVVGVIEIAAGIGVALKPRLFSWVVAAWLGVIILNLLLVPGYYDVALRDFGLALAAIALGKLSSEFGSGQEGDRARESVVEAPARN